MNASVIRRQSVTLLYGDHNDWELPINHHTVLFFSPFINVNYKYFYDASKNSLIREILTWY